LAGGFAPTSTDGASLPLEAFVSFTRFHLVVIGGWFTAVAVTLGVRTMIGLSPSLVEAFMAFGVAVLPALILLAVFRGAPPQTIAEVLYDAEHNRNPARESLIADVRNAK
jgi:hypothetical protein